MFPDGYRYYFNVNVINRRGENELYKWDIVNVANMRGIGNKKDSNK